ncbi:hypothetical protein [Pontibacter sp. G13]|uniref:hypothetical protein n=1 Tax=Pontibacter sp. G13 TaxID=3074898 RepID=UPI0028890FE3|nr:hypothetical protein [Pontibacter sp. G13]WNJ19606.1 hypothetical protein RJD25_03885 [Pontibacter sp. G13]
MDMKAWDDLGVPRRIEISSIPLACVSPGQAVHESAVASVFGDHANWDYLPERIMGWLDLNLVSLRPRPASTQAMRGARRYHPSRLTSQPHPR